ncbi:heterotetrameric sarcosine oxidase gamma subunit [Kushneria sinocarnis]|uniref:Heterotetrameric sarcosine oxidase gamma subunit n=1 Tax=Kushneria sinocarnis TaxID=595502 RepID=A0A420WYY6_9GAMM|nr:sarcosine oxidase subunit gamma family protein [Kushneria sinocarnis]RKR06558.1 heterotetrameric sarcosine oxidase gamma subunit [Kushneria sinocarnis]
MSEFAVFDPHPVRAGSAEDSADSLDAARSRSPLHDAASPVSLTTQERAGVLLGERAFLGHLVIRGNAEDPGFVRGVEEALGLELPVTPMTSAVSETARIHWRSPDEWLLIVPGGEEYRQEMALRYALSGHVAVVDVSGGQTVVTLSGQHAREVLMKSAPVDVHPRAFPVGRSVTTCFARAQAMISRVGEEQWELVIRRSYADYLWQWLLDAGQEYGVALQS